MTSSPKAAARAPSTTRWSNVIAIVPTWPTWTVPARTTGRGPTRPTLRIATSGWFTIGVWKSPASLPALVTVKAIAKNPAAFYVNIHTVKYPAGAIRGQLHAGD